jgi:predicted  nucleic acid-binding Zn-ribbon protein
MQTYHEWAKANKVTNHDDGSFRDWVFECLEGQVHEHEQRIAEAFKQEDQRHRYLTNATEKTRRRVNQLERETKALREEDENFDAGMQHMDKMIGQLVAAMLDLERRSLRGRMRTLRGWFV